MLTAFADVKYRCLRMLDRLVSTHPYTDGPSKLNRPEQIKKNHNFGYTIEAGKGSHSATGDQIGSRQKS
jgi:hypothetical protein